MNATIALATGDFRALLDGILSDDRVEFAAPCFCGKSNTVIAVRTGRTVLVWTDAAAQHNSADDEVMIRAEASEDMARQAMDTLRREAEQLNGMAQLINAVNGTVGQGGDFMVI